ncbi:hypothetical protein PV10_04549 [Exophiala mesophila]|uniref:Peptidase M24 domain-containing protein n=1 Tax=Exophiala mesophila TaxID=212818 RepID=A0A0D1ZHM7_EXOME|nr:uncharacterized protein PV10_04549 [Exophiala mesophila]KIV93329.1 hypothetical protein PV10_04549 [Exophiala mesophila]
MKQVEDGIDQIPTDIDDDISFVRTFLLARSRRLKFLWLAIIGLLALGTQQVLSLLPSSTTHSSHHQHHHDAIHAIQKCTIHNLHQHSSFLDTALPITLEEFTQRRNRLAEALHESNIDAFILEPGYSFQYYANISQTDWEPWEPEERPFLMVVQPDVDAESGQILARTSFLAPHFEEDRVRMLGMPFRSMTREGEGRAAAAAPAPAVGVVPKGLDMDLDIIVWEEDENPYQVLRNTTFRNISDVKVTVMVDEEIRDFIVRGLSTAGFETVGLNHQVESVKQRKTSAEIELLRAVNTGTVEAVRQMRPCLVPGLTEDQVTMILNNALLSVGFSLFFNIVLFDENAALPHGGTVTGDMILGYDTMVLIDVGAHFMGYSSDISRSFFIDGPARSSIRRRRCWYTWLMDLVDFLSFKESSSSSSGQVSSSTPEQNLEHSDLGNLHTLKLEIWNLVLAAQDASILAMTPAHAAADVDVAARDVISAAGYGDQFTHRVGHGIGIKAHESPYLNKGNTHARLLPGMTFTSEPGVYLESKFGVRHEDVFLVSELGLPAECLSGRRAQGPWDP